MNKEKRQILKNQATILLCFTHFGAIGGETLSSVNDRMKETTELFLEDLKESNELEQRREGALK